MYDTCLGLINILFIIVGQSLNALYKKSAIHCIIVIFLLPRFLRRNFALIVTKTSHIQGWLPLFALNIDSKFLTFLTQPA